MSLLTRVLQVAMQEQAQLLLSHRRLENSRAAVCRFPDDILRILFTEVDHPSIGHVCDLWRMISKEIPSLWRKLHLTVKPGIPVSYETAQLWVKRSRSHPLNIEIDLSLADIFPPEAERLKLFLAPCWPRCRAFSLSTRSDLTAEMFLPLPTPTPLLENLTINISMESNIALVKVFSEPFPLRSFVMKHNHEHLGVDISGLPTANLRRIEIEAPRPDPTFLSFFPIPNLETMILRDNMGFFRPEPLPAGSQIILPHLTILGLTGWAYNYAPYIIGQNVHTLTLPFSSEFQHILPTIKAEAFPLLRKVVVEAGGDDIGRDVVNFLRQYPDLEELEISCQTFIDVICGNMDQFETNRAEMMCPNLRILTINEKRKCQDFHWIEELLTIWLDEQHRPILGKIIFECPSMAGRWSEGMEGLFKSHPSIITFSTPVATTNEKGDS